MPNILSVLRLALAPIFPMLYWLAPRPAADWLFFALFSLAMITDFLDGWLARRFDLGSAFGRMIDPIADKAAVLVALFLWATLWHIDRSGAPIDPIVFGAAVLILLRELVVSGLREHLGGVALRVSKLAKIKTVLQSVAIAALLLDQAWRAEIVAACTSLACPTGTTLTIPALTALWAAVLLTVWTGVEYAQAAARAGRP